MQGCWRAMLQYRRFPKRCGDCLPSEIRQPFIDCHERQQKNSGGRISCPHVLCMLCEDKTPFGSVAPRLPQIVSAPNEKLTKSFESSTNETEIIYVSVQSIMRDANFSHLFNFIEKKSIETTLPLRVKTLLPWWWLLHWKENWFPIISTQSYINGECPTER